MDELVEVDEDPITDEIAASILKDDEELQKLMSRKDRKKHRKTLSNPSTISPRLSSLLAINLPPEYIVIKIHKLLNATHLTKGGQVIDDNRALEAGIKLWLHYTVGKPVERMETVNVNVDATVDQLKEQIAKSPALKARMEKLLGEESGEE